MHELSERREASKTAKIREGPRHAFEIAAEREARFVKDQNSAQTATAA